MEINSSFRASEQFRLAGPYMRSSDVGHGRHVSTAYPVSGQHLTTTSPPQPLRTSSSVPCPPLPTPCPPLAHPLPTPCPPLTHPFQLALRRLLSLTSREVQSSSNAHQGTCADGAGCLRAGRSSSVTAAPTAHRRRRAPPVRLALGTARGTVPRRCVWAWRACCQPPIALLRIVPPP